YDLILSEPSNPWVSGVSGLFTTEFYAGLKRHLAEGGVFGQWLHFYELDDDLALRVLAAIHRNFPAYEIFLTTNTDMLIVAGTGPRLPAPDWSVFSSPGIRQDLCRFVPLTPATLEATRLGGRELFAPLLDSIASNSDFHPTLDSGAEKRVFIGQAAVGLQGLSSDRFSIAGLLEGRRYGLSDDPALGARIPRLSANSVAAQVRAERAGLPVDRRMAEDASDAVFTARLWRASLDSKDKPGSWENWVRQFEDNERLVSGGAQGTADEVFYRAVYQYIERHRAPPPVRAVVDFYHGLAAWDFPKVIYASDRLIPEIRRKRLWIAPDELRDGTVVAELKVGDAGAARRVFDALAPMSARPADGLQSRLLDAHISAAERR
ncbi:MAG TPA: hypothetical protein VEB59_07105, partial [Gemmatimonadales bacterium]|nr:hypothetical protein [Gemmatimonadales bacterium]